jgi:TetR/AcrR family transcriptional repressor of nem operon
MARPRKHDSNDVEQALLDVFWSRGYAGTSIEHLTEATGLLRGSLYATYGSKEEMFRTAAARYSAGLADAIATDITGLDAVEHVLETVTRLTLRDRERRGCLILNAIPEADALSDETWAFFEKSLESMQTLFRKHLRAAQAKAGTDLDLEPLVAMVFAASVSIRVLGRAGQKRRLLDDITKGSMGAVRRFFE